MGTGSIVFIVGPTASGKSALAMRVAQSVGGEIICADSQTLRKGMNLGTAKPTNADQQAVRHHMLDIIDPYERFSVAEFKVRAEAAILDIQSRGKVPIIVGGTGLYVDALFYNYSFTARPADEALRNSLQNKSVQELQELIVQKGLPLPQNSKNPRHLVRTLESGGIKATDKTPRKHACIAGLTVQKEALIERIQQRIDIIFKQGFLQEVQQLVKTYGMPPASPQAFDAIAYKLTMNYLREGAEASRLPELKTAIAHAEANYTKRQMTWFKRNVYTQWFEDSDSAYNFLCSEITH